jgi:hypothetical protein
MLIVYETLRDSSPYMISIVSWLKFNIDKLCKFYIPYILEMKLLLSANDFRLIKWPNPSILEMPLLLSQRATKLQY